MILHTNFDKGRQKITMYHKISGIDISIFDTNNALDYNLKLKKTCSSLIITYARENPQIARVFLVYKWLFNKEPTRSQGKL